MLGPLHSARQRDLLEEQVADAVDTGAEVLHGAKDPRATASRRATSTSRRSCSSPLETRGSPWRRSSDPRFQSGRLGHGGGADASERFDLRAGIIHLDG